jgi:valyl-tRNA synthetase
MWRRSLSALTVSLRRLRITLTKLNSKLSSEGFISKAPEAVVAAEREKAEKLKALIENLEDSAKKLKALN